MLGRGPEIVGMGVGMGGGQVVESLERLNDYMVGHIRYEEEVAMPWLGAGQPRSTRDPRVLLMMDDQRPTHGPSQCCCDMLFTVPVPLYMLRALPLAL